MDDIDADTPGAIVRDLYLAYRRALQRELAPRNVSLPQWTFLRILWHEDGLTQKALSELAGNHPSTSVDTLRSLERDGWIERRPDPADGRAVRVYLTRKGRALRSVLIPCAVRANKIATADMTAKELSTLRRLLLKMHSNLEQGAG